MPWGIILGPFAGAVIGEMVSGKDTDESIRAGFGSLVGNVLTAVSGLVLSGVMAYFYFAEIIRLIWG